MQGEGAVPKVSNMFRRVLVTGRHVSSLGALPNGIQLSSVAGALQTYRILSCVTVTQMQGKL